MTVLRLAAASLIVSLVGCGAASGDTALPIASLATARADIAPKLDVRSFAGRPRLAAVTRDGDPFAAVVAAVATDLDPAITTALAALVEARLRAAGIDVDVRVDRSAFHVRAWLTDGARARAFLSALAGAFAREVTDGSELVHVSTRLASLKRNPLDATELEPIAACTGALGIAPGDRAVDAVMQGGARALDAARRAALTVQRTAIGVTGPHDAVAAVARALEDTSGWMDGSAAIDAWPASDAAGVYAIPSPDHKPVVRLSVAARISDPALAVGAAERLGAPSSALAARLGALASPYRVVEVVGAARPRGGCVSVVVEPVAGAPEASNAIVAAIVRSEIIAAAGAVSSPLSAMHLVAASDPREAASRAAWWSIAAAAPPSPPRWATALGLPAERARVEGARFRSDLERLVMERGPVAERKLSAERGQGELWVMLASPCAPADDAANEAGSSALASLAAARAPRPSDGVVVEPWITADGVGIIAHAAALDDREGALDLAKRVADAAARALVAAPLDRDVITTSRSVALDHIERAQGPRGAAFGLLTGALAPGCPSCVDPFGLYKQIVSVSPEIVRARREAIIAGPLRVAVIANADTAQATAAADAIDRWLLPGAGRRSCAAANALAAKPGKQELRNEGGLAQGLVAIRVPAPGAIGRVYAELTEAALDGQDGLVGPKMSEHAAIVSARLIGGGRTPALIVDLRAPQEGLAAAMTDLRASLAHLAPKLDDAALRRASAIVEQRALAARIDPRRRIAQLWRGAPPAQQGRATLDAWRAYIGRALSESELVTVETRAE